MMVRAQTFTPIEVAHSYPEIANLAANVVELSDVHISEPSLENLFLHHTGRSLRE